MKTGDEDEPKEMENRSRMGVLFQDFTKSYLLLRVHWIPGSELFAKKAELEFKP